MSKTFFDPTIALQKEIGDQIYEALQGPILEYLRNESDAGEADNRTKEIQENNSMMIEENTFPDLYRLCMQAKQTIGFAQDIEFYLTANPKINARAIATNNPDKQPHVIELHSGIVQLMSEQELLYVIGHEIGHLINGDAQLRKLRNFIFDKEDDVPTFLTSRFELYRLLSELGADRYGFIACDGDEKAAITAEYKLASGIDIGKMNVSLKALIDENQKHLDYFLKSDRFVGDTHPVHPIRVHALHLYATCKTEEQLDAEMAKLEDRFFQLSERDATINHFYVAAGLLLGNIDGALSDGQRRLILDYVGRKCWFPVEFMEQVAEKHDLEVLYHNSISLLAENDEDDTYEMLDYLIAIAFADEEFSENELHFIYRFGHEVGWEDAEIAEYISKLLSRHFVHKVSISRVSNDKE